MEHEKAYKWTQMWGVDADMGEFDEGDVILVEKKDGTAFHYTVAAVMPYLTKSGKWRVKALVSDSDSDSGND